MPVGELQPPSIRTLTRVVPAGTLTVAVPEPVAQLTMCTMLHVVPSHAKMLNAFATTAKESHTIVIAFAELRAGKSKYHHSARYGASGPVPDSDIWNGQAHVLEVLSGVPPVRAHALPV